MFVFYVITFTVGSNRKLGGEKGGKQHSRGAIRKGMGGLNKPAMTLGFSGGNQAQTCLQSSAASQLDYQCFNFEVSDTRERGVRSTGIFSGKLTQ